MFTEKFNAPEKTLMIEQQLDERGYKMVKRTLSQKRHIEEIDMAKVVNINSSGIALLLKLYRENAKNGRTIRLVNLNPRVRTYLELTRVSNLFDIAEAPAENIGLAA